MISYRHTNACEVVAAEHVARATVTRVAAQGVNADLVTSGRVKYTFVNV